MSLLADVAIISKGLNKRKIFRKNNESMWVDPK